MAKFKVGDLAVYVVSRGPFPPLPQLPLLRVGTVVRVVLQGHFDRGDMVAIGGCRRSVTMAADYIVANIDCPDIIANVRGWQLVRYGDPEQLQDTERARRSRSHD
jgi:hypothetical protein